MLISPPFTALNKSIKNIGICGSGNVATNLGLRLLRGGINIEQIWSRNKPDSAKLAATLNARVISSPTEFNSGLDLILIAVSDDSIQAVSKTIPNDIACVHTSGTGSIELLEEKKLFGSFYPLQTLNKQNVSDSTTVPILIEANNEGFEIQLMELGRLISEQVQGISSVDRRKLHLAAVIVNNFVNQLYSESHKYCKAEDLSFDLLRPLIAETAARVQSNAPEEMQTGPAKRNDRKTVEQHLEMLAGNKELTQLYQLLTQLIIKTHAK